MTRASPSAPATLRSLSLSGISLKPEFTRYMHDGVTGFDGYTATVLADVKETTLRYALMHSADTVEVTVGGPPSRTDDSTTGLYAPVTLVDGGDTVIVVTVSSL